MYTKENSPGYRVSLLSRLYGPVVNSCFEHLEITFGQVPFILEILDHPGQTQEKLSEIISVDKAATARILAALEVKGFLLRKENPENRRQKLIYPTKKLTELTSEIRKLQKTINEGLLNGFTPSERETALKILDQLILNCKEIKNDKEI